MMKVKIIIDSREKQPLWTRTTDQIESPDNQEIEFKHLKTGDYSIKGFEDKFTIERKSISDLYGTLGQGHTRFKKEIARGLDMEYFAIVIDGTYNNILKKSFGGSKFTQMKGTTIISILFTIHLKYKIPIFFSTSREQSKQIILELMTAYLKCK